MVFNQADRGRGRWRMLRQSEDFSNGSIVEAADHFVARLGLARTASWGELHEAVEGVYGKPIYLVASNSSSLRAVTGLWIDTAEFGAVVCRERDDLHVQSQNACHELAHILFVHAPKTWFTDLLPRPQDSSNGVPGTTQFCPPTAGAETPESRIEEAIEEVAFAMTRRIQSINRTAEETYFG
ncbi:hypothetical protein [Subtercola boreus]|uniref:hypothetical protein n=1 Tax=Subtercola boreus TaxID=120213 RepID=UPI0011C05D06|nr:hypothetical protein [Subtercola boreus]